MTNFEKELSILFISTGFLRMYLDAVSQKENQEYPILLLSKLRRLSLLYSKQLDTVVDRSTAIFEEIEKETKKLKPLPKFKKRLRLSDNDVEVNGLLFATALLLEHKDIKNRKLNFDYKLVNDIYSSFNGIKDKGIDNSRVMATKYMDKIIKD